MHLALKNGMSLHVSHRGAGANACLLLHGFGDGAYIWDTCLKPLSAHFDRVVAPDLRGHGDSAWDPEGRYSLEGYRADLLLLIVALRLNRFSIIGHSLGARLALEIAAVCPRQVERLVLVDFGLDANMVAAEYMRESFAAQFRQYQSVEEYRQWLVRKRPIVNEPELQHVATSALRLSGRVYEPKCDPALARGAQVEDVRDIAEILRGLLCPVLLVRGEASAILSQASALDTLRQLRNGKLVVVAGAGHCVMTDNPGGFVEAVSSFVRSISRDAAARPFTTLYC
jgi:pimeloyl-ACP methyl ester carboxylesterase